MSCIIYYYIILICLSVIKVIEQDLANMASENDFSRESSTTSLISGSMSVLFFLLYIIIFLCI